MSEQYSVLIVGTGHAGAQAAIALRQGGFSGSIALLGDEPEPPYERPPLSKEYLSGEKSFERMLIRPNDFWSNHDIHLMLGRRVVAIEAAAHRASLMDGASVGYGHLVWAAGGAPRRLACPGNDLHGVHTVRSRADIDRIQAELGAVERVVVVGAGYIGLEMAAVLTKLGKRVTVIEALDRVFARVAGEPLSRFYESEHRAHGVDLRLGARVERILGDRNGRAIGVMLSHDDVSATEIVAADLVIVGIGIIPAVAPVLAAGAEGGNGVKVDARCRTSLPNVFAIGDCALHNNRFADDAEIRLESVQNATDQATIVANELMGAGADYEAVPWFWSNQFDLKLQTVGLSAGHDQAIVRGDTSTRSFSVVYLRDHRVIALDCVNASKDYVQGRSLVRARAVVETARVSDLAIPLKEAAAL